MITFTSNAVDKTLTLNFKGRMDTLAVATLSEILQAEPLMQDLKPDDKLIFNLRDVDYIASSFIRICVSYSKLVGPDRFSMTNCQPFVKKTFKISGLDEFLNIT
jgi:anti-anti-sigma factor